MKRWQGHCATYVLPQTGGQAPADGTLISTLVPIVALNGSGQETRFFSYWVRPELARSLLPSGPTPVPENSKLAEQEKEKRTLCPSLPSSE